MIELNQETLKQILSYDPDSGIFRRKVSLSNRSKPGVITGNKPAARGYGLIKVNEKRYYAHRLAWLFVYGSWPFGEIDHINNNRLDNRIANLRIATRAQNSANSPTRAASGYRGVYRSRNKWTAQITIGGKTNHLGTFSNPEEAHRCYAAAAEKYHGQFSYLSKSAASALLTGGVR